MNVIAGIFSKDGGNVSTKIRLMLQAMSKEFGHVYLQRAQGPFVKNLMDFEASAALGWVEPLKPYTDRSKRLTLIFDGKIYGHKNLARERHDLAPKSDGEIVVHLLEKYYKGDLTSAVKSVVKNLDGGYVFVVTNGVETAVAKDPVGVRPAYYAEGSQLMAFASEKKALWKVGFGDVERLRGGMLLNFKTEGVEISKVWRPNKADIPIQIKDLDVALNRYRGALYLAVEKRVEDLKEVGILMSGGVDSSLLAKVTHEVASRLGIRLVGYTAGLANSPDLKSARSFAEQLGIPLRIRKLTSSDVEKLIPKVIRAVEERDFNQVETSIALYAVVEMARKDGIRVLLNGQGPDELWGGYVWYPKLLEEVGYDRLHEQLWEDFSMADVETLERENKVAKTLDVQIRYPYLNLRVIRTAMSIAPSLKVQSGTDPLGKYVHRELAKKLGVPKAYAERPKEAFQHGAGIHTVLDQIAQKNGFNEKLSRSIGYSSDKISKEKLGSSTRYGYKYSQKGSWLVPDHVQLYLDIVAYENNLLNKDEREKIEKFLEICQDRGRVVSRTTGK